LFTYYSSGNNSLESEAMRSVLVYTPASSAQVTRFQGSTDRGYIKTLSHGYHSELPRLAQELPPDRYAKIADMFQRDSFTGDEWLAVPSRHVTEVYKPKDALVGLLEGVTKEYSETSIDKLRSAVNVFSSQGIEVGRLGLYGGLQCGLTHVGNKEINDVDLLVDRLESYENVVELSKGNKVRPETFPAFIAGNAIKRAVAMRRGQLSQFRLVDYPDTVVDIRLLRVGNNSSGTLAIASQSTQPSKGIRLSNALIVGAAESLSVPARYEVQSAVGERWSVITNQYHHLGAASVGDQVSIRGGVVQRDTIMLTQPEHHHIYMPESS
jgi:predicted nucleotidyltransferase